MFLPDLSHEYSGELSVVATRPPDHLVSDLVVNVFSSKCVPSLLYWLQRRLLREQADLSRDGLEMQVTGRRVY